MAATVDLSVDNLSRFFKSEPIIVDGKVTFGRWKRPDWMNPDLVASTDVLLVQVDQNYAGRPDLVVQDFYGTPYLEWVITMFNRPLNPIGFPKAGSVIKVLSRTLVYSNI